MPASNRAHKKLVQIPYSECAMHCGVQGQELPAIEEDLYLNGNVIPDKDRLGCYVLPIDGGRIHMLKIEAGWKD